VFKGVTTPRPLKPFWTFPNRGKALSTPKASAGFFEAKTGFGMNVHSFLDFVIGRKYYLCSFLRKFHFLIGKEPIPRRNSKKTEDFPKGKYFTPDCGVNVHSFIFRGHYA
jgi:hypothetical protein